MSGKFVRAIFPGSFDPITNGHLDVINRGMKLFDELIIAVGRSPVKNQLFTPKERVEMISELIDKQKPAEFGQFLFWDLEGRAIRGMEYSGLHQQYFILAGGVDQEIAPALYCWEGDFNDNPQKLYQWPQSDPPFTPEGIATEPNTGLLWVFSDDGSLEITINSRSDCMEGQLLPNKRCLNKHLKLDAQKKFRVRPMSLRCENHD